MSEWLSSMCSLPLCCIQARNVLGDSNSIPSFPAAYVEGLGGVPITRGEGDVMCDLNSLGNEYTRSESREEWLAP